MTEEFNPPISERDSDELIIIVHSPKGDWQESALAQAKAELEKRGITDEQQLNRIQEIDAEIQHEWELELERRKTEDYSRLDKVFLFLFCYRYIFSDWNLKKEGYLLKAKRRKQLLAIGFISYFALFTWAYKEGEELERKRIEEINNIDISDWEKRHDGVDSMQTPDTMQQQDTYHVRDFMQLKNEDLQEDFFRHLDSTLQVQYPNKKDRDEDAGIFAELNKVMLVQFLQDIDQSAMSKNGSFEKEYYLNIAPKGYFDKCKDKISIAFNQLSSKFSMRIFNSFKAEQGWCTEHSVVYFFSIHDNRVVDFDRNAAG